MASTAVFLGPSLPRSAAKDIFDARYLPPVKRGDIAALLAEDDPPERIAIVDGQFLQQMSISPKEILIAIDRGVSLYGSSSMGALRSVELAPYGMIGIGRIFDLFESGAVDADDEVAITFDQDSLRNLCEPMVNIRLAVADALADGVIDHASATAIVAAGKALYFPERTYPAVLAAIEGIVSEGQRSAFATYLREVAPDAKGEDARELLELLRDDGGGSER